jgi:hypothetical protein
LKLLSKKLKRLLKLMRKKLLLLRVLSPMMK